MSQHLPSLRPNVSHEPRRVGDQFPNDRLEWLVVISLIAVVAITWGVILL